MHHQVEGTAAPTKCHQCEQQPGSPLICQHCRTLCETEGVDHFALLGLRRRYDINLKHLHARFIELSRQVHPDYFVETDLGAKLLALRNSARLNRAYQTLKDPFDRAEYLLELAGGKSSATDRNVAPEILAEVVELREQVEQVKQQDDRATLTELRDRTLQMRSQVESRIAYLAEKTGEPAVDHSVLDELRRQLNAANYINNLLRQF